MFSLKGLGAPEREENRASARQLLPLKPSEPLPTNRVLDRPFSPAAQQTNTQSVPSSTDIDYRLKTSPVAGSSSARVEIPSSRLQETTNLPKFQSSQHQVNIKQESDDVRLSGVGRAYSNGRPSASYHDDSDREEYHRREQERNSEGGALKVNRLIWRTQG